MEPAWLLPGKSYCHPDWGMISKVFDSNQTDDALQEFYTHVCRLWMNCLLEEFGPGYHLVESANFILISRASENVVCEALQFLERCYYRIRRGMPFLPDKLGYGKWPVLCLYDDAFYRYLSDYIEDEEGSFASVGGVFLSRGYGHFALPSEDLHLYSQVLAHELSHALLTTLELPAWLDEAITMGVEERLASGNAYFLDREMIRRHQDYWTEEAIQAFWAGTSFWFPDEGQELSYHLSRFLFRALYQGGSVDPAAVGEFIKNAKREDAGYLAAKDVLDIDLAEVLSHLIGEGDWRPNRETIQRLRTETGDS